jgi:hypothetical protein
MASYCYYDENGILREFVNSEATNQGDNGDVVYFYFYNVSPVTVTAFLTLPNSGSDSFVLTTETVQIPYDSARELKYFSYNTDYLCYKLTLLSTTDHPDLVNAGLLTITPYLAFSSSSKSYGVYNVIVNSNSVQLDQSMGMANYTYLLSLINSSVSDKTLITTKIPASLFTITDLGGDQYSYTATFTLGVCNPALFKKSFIILGVYITDSSHPYSVCGLALVTTDSTGLQTSYDILLPVSFPNGNIYVEALVL